MRIAICHNYFRQRGGEDQVFEDELGLLTSHDHEVTAFVKHNDDFEGFGATTRIALGTPWNRSAAAELGDLVRKTKSEIVHFHNWLPQISPAAFYSARKAGAAVVQTLHNYRWVCPKGILFRDGSVCEDCLGKRIPWPAVRYGCYHESRTGSFVVGAALALHNSLHTTTRAIDAFIAPGSFIKEKLAASGLPRDRIHIKPNFLTADPGAGPGTGGYAIYVGRLSPEKKVDTLLEAWELLETPVPLKISGIGPLRSDVEAAASRDPNIEYLGFASNEDLDTLVGDARALVFTSGTYEAQPMTILEAYAKGTPVIASRMGAMQDLVKDGETGWHFTPSDARDLARVVAGVFDPARDLTAMRDGVRNAYLQSFTPEPNHTETMKVYEAALKHRHDHPENVP